MASVAPPTVAADGASDKTINPRRSERLKNIEATSSTPVNIQPRSTLRARCPVDPVRRRKQAWPFKWETWRINAVAFQMSRSDPQVIEHIRASQDELWKTSPQDASLNEDALLVYDEQQQVQEVACVQNPVQESVLNRNDDCDATLLLNLEYSSDPKAYVEHEATGNKTLKLFTNRSKRAKVAKPKRAVKRLQHKVVTPAVPPALPAPSVPAGLPLKAPRNTPGIPNNALALNEFSKKDTPCALGVQLPTNRARTLWEWAPYASRKAENAQFNWSNDTHIREANRWRQQRIRRRFVEHGVVEDGRKRH